MHEASALVIQCFSTSQINAARFLATWSSMFAMSDYIHDSGPKEAISIWTITRALLPYVSKGTLTFC